MPSAKSLVHLARSIRKWDLVAVVVNGIIGAGIFGLPSKAFALIGAYSIVAFGICAVCVGVIILSFAEVASRYSRSGGPYSYACDTYGPNIGFVVGWLVWTTRVTAFAANCNLLPAYLGFFLPWVALGNGRLLTIASTAFVLTLINICGVRQTVLLSNLSAVAKLLILGAFVAVGLFYLSPSGLSFVVLPSYRPLSSAVLILVYAFTGFEMAVIPAGEAAKPREHLPVALLLGLSIVVILYIGIQIVCVGTLPNLANSQRPLADAANHFAGYSGGVLVGAGIIISLAGNLNILMLSGSRVIFAIAEQKQLPSVFTFVHPRFFTPIWAVLFTGATVRALAISGTFIYLVTISTLARLITYLATCGALPLLRRRKAMPAPAFVAPGGSFVAYAGGLICLWLLSNSTLIEARDTGIALALGLLILLVSRTVAPAPSVDLTRQSLPGSTAK